MRENILNDTKKVLGITEDCKHFDLDILMHINTAFMVLKQLGVGPKSGFICEELSTWDEFMDTEKTAISSVKTYVYLKTRVLFDPPTSSAVMDCLNRNISELEWRLNASEDVGEKYVQ